MTPAKTPPVSDIAQSEVPVARLQAVVLCSSLSPSDTSPLYFPVYQNFLLGRSRFCYPMLFCYPMRAEGEIENVLLEVKVYLFLFTFIYKQNPCLIC